MSTPRLQGIVNGPSHETDSIERGCVGLPCASGVMQGVFLGSLGAALKREELDRVGVGYILTVATGILPAYPDHFRYILIDGENAVVLFSVFFLFVRHPLHHLWSSSIPHAHFFPFLYQIHAGTLSFRCHILYNARIISRLDVVGLATHH